MYFPSFHLRGGIRDTLVKTYRNASRAMRSCTFGVFETVSAWGQTETMRQYERKKLSIFNQVNIFQLLLGSLVIICCLFGKQPLTLSTYIALLLPLVANLMVLMMNRQFQYQSALISYFIITPVLTSFVYMGGMDFGFELTFILFGILSVFFLQERGLMFFSIGLSMVSYFVLSVLWTSYSFRLEFTSPIVFITVQVVLIALIFYGLLLIKNENNSYQLRILDKNRLLKASNLEIERINVEIHEKAEILEQQKIELQDLHAEKNKLFSIIAHDLRAPIQGLKNIFTYINDHKLPAKEIKGLMPDVVREVNSTKELMDNLLQWAKAQMGGAKTRMTPIDIYELSASILQLLRPQAVGKQIVIDNRITPGLIATGDEDMIHLIFRNLVSNAIKYTPVNGRITVEAVATDEQVELFVRDTGVGMDAATLDRIQAGNFYTLKGTCNESGTGLGLMLCRDFINRNGGQLNIISQPGEGSVFSFTMLPAESFENVKAV